MRLCQEEPQGGAIKRWHVKHSHLKGKLINEMLNKDEQLNDKQCSMYSNSYIGTHCRKKKKHLYNLNKTIQL